MAEVYHICGKPRLRECVGCAMFVLTLMRANMAEIVPTYKLNDLDQAIPMDRKEFYDTQIEEYKKNGKPSRSVESIKVLLFTPEKELILQKRSNKKRHNPGLIDKTIGGHIRFGESANYTVLCETLQELEVPSMVLNSDDDFQRAYKLLSSYVNRSALIQFIDRRTANFVRLFDGEPIEIASTYNFYLGVYQGGIRPADREVSGVMFYTLDSLKKELKEYPKLFTPDVSFFLGKYEKEIGHFLKNIS